MFAAIDRGRTGRIGFGAFVEWLLTMTHGGAEDRLRYVSYHIISYCIVLLHCILGLCYIVYLARPTAAPRTDCGRFMLRFCCHIILQYYIILCHITVSIFGPFVGWLSTITIYIYIRGRWGFQVCDTDGDGRVTRAEASGPLSLLYIYIHIYIYIYIYYIVSLSLLYIYIYISRDVI